MDKNTAPLIRINKLLADKGLTSRREADALIEKRQVMVDGKVAKLGDKFPSNAKIEIKNKGAQKKLEYFLYYKPRDIVTVSAQKNEKAINDVVKVPKGVVPIGRLDKDSEGLLLLTNDGRITKRLLEPQFDHEKEYEVTTREQITQTFLNALSRGVQLEGFRTKSAKTKKVSEKIFRIILTEGKNRQIRRMCEKFHFSVSRLIRIRILSMTIKNLASGQLRPLSEKEKVELLTSLKLA